MALVVVLRFSRGTLQTGQIDLSAEGQISTFWTEGQPLDVLAPWARRAARLVHIVHHLGLALGGRSAASFAKRLVVPLSNDTLLRVVRQRGSPRFVPPTVDEVFIDAEVFAHAPDCVDVVDRFAAVSREKR